MTNVPSPNANPTAMMMSTMMMPESKAWSTIAAATLCPSTFPRTSASQPTAKTAYACTGVERAAMQSTVHSTTSAVM